MSRLRADALLLMAAAIWGSAFIAQKTAMDHLSPLWFVALRGLVAALTLAPLAWWEHGRRGAVGTGELMRLAPLAGLLFFLGAIFQQEGLVTASVTNTALLTVLYTVFTPLIAWLVLRRWPSPLVWPAIALSCVGTWLLGGGGFTTFGRGDWMVVVSAVFWAGHVVATGVSAGLDRPLTFNMMQFTVLAVLGILAAALFGGPIDLDRVLAAWKELAYVGVLSSAVSFTILTLALRNTPPAEAAVLVSTETLFAATAAYLLLGERLDRLGWLGAAGILAAAMLLQLGAIFANRPAQRKR